MINLLNKKVVFNKYDHNFLISVLIYNLEKILIIMKNNLP